MDVDRAPERSIPLKTNAVAYATTVTPDYVDHHGAPITNSTSKIADYTDQTWPGAKRNQPNALTTNTKMSFV